MTTQERSEQAAFFPGNALRPGVLLNRALALLPDGTELRYVPSEGGYWLTVPGWTRQEARAVARGVESGRRLQKQGQEGRRDV